MRRKKEINSYLIFSVMTFVLVTVFGLLNYIIDQENIFSLNIFIPLILLSAIISLTVTLMVSSFRRYMGQSISLIITPMIGLIPAVCIFLFSFLTGPEERVFGVAIALILGILGIILGLILGLLSLLFGMKK